MVGSIVGMPVSEGGNPYWHRMEKLLLWLRGHCCRQTWQGEVGAPSPFVDSYSTFIGTAQGSG